MSSTKAKVQRALYGPSVMEVTLGTVLSLLIGVALGAVYLVLKPVEVLRELPAEREPGVVYYQEGPNRPSMGRQWLRKRQMLIEGVAAEITWSEDELNGWMSSSTARPDANSASGSMLVPQTVNFRMEGDVFQIGLPSQLNFWGQQRSIIIQARGGFKDSDEGFVFVPRELMIGSLSAHRIPGLKAIAMNRIRTAIDMPDEVKAAWQRLEHVEVRDGLLRLVLP